MTLKIIQLNCWTFQYIDNIIELIKTQKPDVINLQEVVNTNLLYERKVADNSHYDGQDLFEVIKKATGYEGHFAPSWSVVESDGSLIHWGNAFLTNLEILDYGHFYDKYGGEYEIKPKNLEPFYKTEEKTARYISNYKKPLAFVWGLLQKEGIVFKNITTHFTVAYNPEFDTLQSIQQAEQIQNFVTRAKNIPTIFTADTNLMSKTISLSKIIGSCLQMESQDLLNTCNKQIHPAFDPKRAFHLRDVLPIDHVFQKGFVCQTIQVLEDKNYSDHCPVVAILESL
jgi:endonuclease/exonuclease/phosphatase family metal-dependent hydrolase